MAADAKVVLDDDAMSRHPARATPVAWSSESEFMKHCRALGVIGVDNRSRCVSPGASYGFRARKPSRSDDGDI